ncbi:hypothetical protein K435DRAFT_844962 [Dendrothele bispora CBS 962.96]|uniref:Uncharacterized protein n=1 Tax=Dendrothele bispora (strain CBS 962.96) TaxID=1314807 RepID=A0A4S8KXT7_DENBC|nr:hypothetical protein K435DRAFT_844962 [Dendrothele bispora CBS 962.96]
MPLLLYALARPLVPSLLASTNNGSLPSPEASLEAHNSCFDIRSCRTVEEILYSCLAVVFACTWVAIHPNIPRHFDVSKWDSPEVADSFTISSARVIAQDVITMLLSLLAPELIILWALRQWFAARKIEKKYNKYGWTKTHGHFLIMGGFALFEDGKYVYTLEDSNEFRPLRTIWEPGARIDEWNLRHQIESQNSQGEKTRRPSQEGRLEDCNSQSGGPPDPDDSTQDADAPQSESAPLSESSEEPSEPRCLVEFLIQHKYIDITEDEITARSKTDFLTKSIAVVQTTWFILQCIARVTEELVVTDLEIVTVAFALLNIATYVLWWNKPQRVRYPVKIDYCRRHSKSEITVEEGRSAWESSTSWIKGRVEAMLSLTSKFRDRLFQRRTRSAWKSFTSWIQGIWDVISDADFNDILLSTPLAPSITQLSTGEGSYYTGLELDDPSSIVYPAIPFFLVFGGVHCAPWNSTFPTDTEQLLWRVSAAAVTAFPLVWFSLLRVLLFLNGYGWTTTRDRIDKGIIFMVAFFLPLVYIWARVTLIVIAFTELRGLPPSAYQTVDWARFIPHI